MFTLRPTLRLAQKFRITIPSAEPSIQNNLTDWCLQDFNAGRRYYLFVNTASLYPVVVPARGLTTLTALIGGFRDELKLRWDDSPLHCGRFERSIEPELSYLRFARIPNRSIQGSINDFVRMGHFHLKEDGDTPLETSRRLAQAPMGILKMHSPENVFAGLVDNPQTA